jgi:hypothetical protein
MPARWNTLICSVLLVAVAAIVAAVFVDAGAVDIPRTINYQGLLTDKETGEPLPGTYSLTFSIYAQVSGGAALWTETKDVTTDESGVFSTLLGSTNPINLTFATPSWLEIAVGSETLTPRRGLTSVPYAFQAMSAVEATSALTALNADSLGGLTSASYSLVGHLHDDRYCTEAELSTTGTINGTSNPVDWTKLKGVPAGFADDTDNEGAGDGHSLDAADGNPTDVAYVDDTGKVLVHPGIWSVADSRLVVYDAASAAVWARSDSSSGVVGHSLYGLGISGWSHKGYGVAGASDSSAGIYGSGQNGEGVVGLSIDGRGVVGSSTNGSGVEGMSTNGHGISGWTENGNGVVGWSTKSDGIWGSSRDGKGVFGASVESSGVHGWSTNGSGVVGGSANGKAGEFWGEVHATGRVDSDSGFSIDGQTLLATPGESNLFVGHAGRLYFEVPQRSTCVGESTGCLNLGDDNTFLGYRAGNGGSTGYGVPPATTAVAGGRNVFAGARSGAMNQGDDNVFIGYAAGTHNASGFNNTFVGRSAGNDTESGRNNVFLGASAGWSNSSGEANVFCGTYAGQYRATTSGNTYLGFEAGSSTYGIGTTGNDNVAVGSRAGYRSDGDGNVFLGHEAGYEFNGNDRLFIANGKDPEDVLIYGNFATGNIGLGTTAPERKLHILGDGPRVLVEAMTGNPEVNLKVTGDSWGDIWAMYKHVDDGDLHFFQGGDRVTFEGGTGNVAIGATDPAGYRLYVNGTAYSTGGWQSSDARLKTDLRGIDDALGKVMRLAGHSFRWRTEDHPDRGFPAGRHYGLVAQEVEEVLPEVVGSGPGDEKALAYSELIPVLVEAVKELKTENDALRARIEALESK